MGAHEPSLFVSPLVRAAERFHAANPHVMDRLLALALALHAKGHRRYGIAGLFEIVRYERAMTTVGDTYRLNNNWRAWYARRLVARDPRLARFFVLRRSEADA